MPSCGRRSSSTWLVGTSRLLDEQCDASVPGLRHGTLLMQLGRPPKGVPASRIDRHWEAKHAPQSSVADGRTLNICAECQILQLKPLWHDKIVIPVVGLQMLLGQRKPP